MLCFNHCLDTGLRGRSDSPGEKLLSEPSSLALNEPKGLAVNHVSSFAQDQSEPISVSASAYYALCLFMDTVNATKKSWAELPCVGSQSNRWNHYKELCDQKGVCEKRTIDRKGIVIHELRLKVDFSRITLSKRRPHGLPDGAYLHPVFSKRLTPEEIDEAKTPLAASMKIASAPKKSEIVPIEVKVAAEIVQPFIQKARPIINSEPAYNHPVSEGGYKPTFYEVKEWVNAVETWGRDLHKEVNDSLESEINSLKQKLQYKKGREARQILHQLDTLMAKQEHLGLETLIDAIKEVSADKPFQRFNLDEKISIVPHDYLATSLGR